MVAIRPSPRPANFDAQDAELTTRRTPLNSKTVAGHPRRPTTLKSAYELKPWANDGLRPYDRQSKSRHP